MLCLISLRANVSPIQNTCHGVTLSDMVIFPAASIYSWSNGTSSAHDSEKSRTSIAPSSDTGVFRSTSNPSLPELGSYILQGLQGSSNAITTSHSSSAAAGGTTRSPGSRSSEYRIGVVDSTSIPSFYTSGSIGTNSHRMPNQMSKTSNLTSLLCTVTVKPTTTTIYPASENYGIGGLACKLVNYTNAQGSFAGQRCPVTTPDVTTLPCALAHATQPFNAATSCAYTDEACQDTCWTAISACYSSWASWSSSDLIYTTIPILTTWAATFTLFNYSLSSSVYTSHSVSHSFRIGNMACAATKFIQGRTSVDQG